MIKTHKIKLCPNHTMLLVLNQLFDYRRYCYNQALVVWQDMYDEAKIADDNSLLPNEHKVRDELVQNKQDWKFGLSARVLQLAVKDLSKAWQNFFNPQMTNHKQPKFKSKKRSRKTFTTDRARIVGCKLRLDKPCDYVGPWYDIRMVEVPRWEGVLKQTTVVMDADGIYASFAFEVVDDPEPVPAAKSVTAVDANVGRLTFKTSEGFATQGTLPTSLLMHYQRITRYKRELARKRVTNPHHFRSNNYRTTKTKLQREYQRVTRIQADLLAKFTHQLIADNSIIAIEDLDNQHMRMNKHLAKKLHRSMFGKFKQMMQYKAEWHGVKLVLVDRFYPSTQRCSRCGLVKTGDERITLTGNQKHHTGHNEFHCYGCGVQLNRDENAVDNLIQYAVNQ